MDTFLNKLDITYYNLIHTNNIHQKEVILNNLHEIYRYYSQIIGLLNYLYVSNPEYLHEFLLKINKQSLILLTRDLNVIKTMINIPENMHILYYDNLFHIDYIPISPSNDDQSIHSEWGY